MPELQTTPVDVERAFNAASDPWAAPGEVVFPTQQYGGGSLLRDAGERISDYPGLGTKRITRLELQAALEHGWTLASVACDDELIHRPFAVVLTKGDSLDSYAVATLTARWSEATVSLRVPHHLDGSWPTTTPVTLEDTCLDGGPLNEAPTQLEFSAYPGEGRPSLEDYEPWQRDTLDDTETALVERVLADPYLSELGADFRSRSDLDVGENWRSALSTGAEVATNESSTRASVADVLQRSGWTTTWISCGEGLPTVATARLPVDDATIVARLISTDPDAVQIYVTIGVPEAPLTWPQIDAVPALTESRCLSDGDVGPGLLLEGTPVATPRDIHPYLR